MRKGTTSIMDLSISGSHYNIFIYLFISIMMISIFMALISTHINIDSPTHKHSRSGTSTRSPMKKTNRVLTWHFGNFLFRMKLCTTCPPAARATCEPVRTRRHTALRNSPAKETHRTVRERTKEKCSIKTPPSTRTTTRLVHMFLCMETHSFLSFFLCRAHITI